MSTLEFQEVCVAYGAGRSARQVIHGVDLRVPSGSIVGLVGESGSGKSTLARAAVGLAEPTSGSIRLDGVEVAHARGRVAHVRQDIQMIFQDPNSCLDPRMSIGDSIDEALIVRARRAGERRSTADRRARVAELLELVELSASRAGDRPSQLSGGQRQRVAIARALAAEPRVILADEITSALDVSVQGTVLNLLAELQRRLSLTVLFISHNLAVVRQLCDEVAVMRDGVVVEQGSAVSVIDDPQHAYTRQLIAAIPRVGVPMFPTEGDHE
ncbi:ABC transporter ATP-binding protein [Microbacterium immunditiarum]|uniref:Peptide/nickel transport system ATP-binding protein n=1 Tax=Microbacterium immunditiarum TaxID=337480 RepID=A0A7Y9KK21_9MICO|nr:ATP-binding cassette domain-containing protein [Microbacterium immunditiarum]NYE18384.1 peptide/nickel transport system ATP-binding protein [Microbacterium immunditiarum]